MFTIISLFVLSLSTHASEHACFDDIKDSVCLTEAHLEYDTSVSFMENERRRLAQSCLPGSAPYAKQIETVFTGLPDHAKEAFCFIKKIYIVDGETPYGAMANYSYDMESAELSSHNGQDFLSLSPDGFVLYLSKEKRFDRNESEVFYQSHMLQYKFGGEIYSDSLLPDLPLYRHQDGPEYSSLYSTILHEIGHFADMAGNYTGIKYDESNSSPIFVGSRWLDFSWDISTQTVYDEGGNLASFFPSITPLVPSQLIIGMNESYPAESWEQNVEMLNGSSFVSYYALASPQEDFAEQYRSFYSIGAWEIVKDGQVYMSSVNRPSLTLEAKNEFIKEIPDTIFAEILIKEPFYFMDNENGNPLVNINFNCNLKH